MTEVSADPFLCWSDDLGIDEPNAERVAGAVLAEDAAREFVSRWFWSDPTNSAVTRVTDGVTVYVRGEGADRTFKIRGEPSMDWHSREANT